MIESGIFPFSVLDGLILENPFARNSGKGVLIFIKHFRGESKSKWSWLRKNGVKYNERRANVIDKDYYILGKTYIALRKNIKSLGRSEQKEILGSLENSIRVLAGVLDEEKRTNVYTRYYEERIKRNGRST